MAAKHINGITLLQRACSAQILLLNTILTKIKKIMKTLRLYQLQHSNWLGLQR